MKNIILIAAILIGFPAFGQEVQHTPTVAECKSDVKLWELQAHEYFVANKSHDTKNTIVSSLSALELLARSLLMADCSSVDSDDYQMYLLAQTNYAGFFNARINNFMKRHNLMDQFFAEDAAGQR